MLEFTDRGIFCPEGDFYIDAGKSVDYNIVTHGHADHARPGHRHYLSHSDSEAILKLRLGKKINITTLPFNQPIRRNGVKISLHPAGHIVGSAQVRIEHKGEVWVVSGDYKLDNDMLSGAFEPVQCHTFVTECTFGLPIYQWPEQHSVYEEINRWWHQNRQEGKTSILCGYSLGKSQRVLYHADRTIGDVYVHPAIRSVNEALRKQGLPLPETRCIGPDVDPMTYRGSLVIAPPSAINSPDWKFIDPDIGVASGWMRIWSMAMRRNADKAFVLSDHADWNGLVSAIRETGAENVITMHGYTSAFSKWLREQGYKSMEA